MRSRTASATMRMRTGTKGVRRSWHDCRKILQGKRSSCAFWSTSTISAMLTRWVSFSLQNIHQAKVPCSTCLRLLDTCSIDLCYLWEALLRILGDMLSRSLVHLHSKLTIRQNSSAAFACSAFLIHAHMPRAQRDSLYTTWPIIETQNVLPHPHGFAVPETLLSLCHQHWTIPLKGLWQ